MNDQSPFWPQQPQSSYPPTPVVDQQSVQDILEISSQLVEQFGSIRTNLFSTSSQIDENLVVARTDAIQTLLEQVMYTMDFLEANPHAYSHLVSQSFKS